MAKKLDLGTLEILENVDKRLEIKQKLEDYITKCFHCLDFLIQRLGTISDPEDGTRFTKELEFFLNKLLIRLDASGAGDAITLQIRTTNHRSGESGTICVTYAYSLIVCYFTFLRTATFICNKTDDLELKDSTLEILIELYSNLQQIQHAFRL